ncbi:MAG: methyltransferase domain-containing protein [Acidobacteria bacterium]|nr:methyltransferase domain-containing protein [Acidobacteriota bacterium]
MISHHTNTEQGHWVLAKMGKRVLRPGGRELTAKLIDALDIKRSDDVVEFAPGMGFTAALTLKRQPKTYTGIELDETAAANLKTTISGDDRKIINTSASETTLDGNSVDKVYGEAMLTMQADHRKSEIIGEAFRILKKGGLYGIHELGLAPDNISAETKADIQRELAQTIKVNARPLTEKEWSDLLEKEGFSIVKIEKNPMSLLEPSRVINDEGFFRALGIVFNIATHPKERRRIMTMRRTFRKFSKNLNAVAIIAKKN